MKKHSLTAVLALALVALAGTAPANQAGDAWITTKTKLALLTSPDVAGTRVNVDTMGGTVTLSGKVASKEEQSRAAEIARGIEGVTNVRNMTTVDASVRRPATMTADEQISKDVKSALAADGRAGSVQVTSVKDGVVVIEGKATRHGDYMHVLRTVNGVPGVVRVESKVTTPSRLDDDELYGNRTSTDKSKMMASDPWTTSAVKLRLLAAEDVPGMSINVDTNDNVVTLFGIVPTEAAKTKAADEARMVDGVKDVRNELQVVPDKNVSAVKASDDEIMSSVKKALASSNDLKGNDIDVEVKNGVVRLTGTITGPGMRYDAATTARGVPGVRAVHDELQVKTATPKG